MTVQGEAADPETLVASVVPPATTPAEIALEALAKDRFNSLMRRFPNFATYLGIDEYDGELSDGTRDAIQAEIDAAHAFESALESIEGSQLSDYHTVERDLALYATRRAIFDEEVHRVWERRVNAADEIGDGIFLVYSRGTRPLEERLSSIASRLEAAPRHIEQQKTRLGTEPPVLLWNEMELDSVKSLPSFFEEIVNTANRLLGQDHPEARRLASAATATSAALMRTPCGSASS